MLSLYIRIIVSIATCYQSMLFYHDTARKPLNLQLYKIAITYFTDTSFGRVRICPVFIRWLFSPSHPRSGESLMPPDLESHNARTPNHTSALLKARPLLNAGTHSPICENERFEIPLIICMNQSLSRCWERCGGGVCGHVAVIAESSHPALASYLDASGLYLARVSDQIQIFIVVS